MESGFTFIIFSFFGNLSFCGWICSDHFLILN
ncbi:hypothetical protein DBR39_10425 [Chryseobacterium sp. KBW03]|nr:hypothetical protein DBR39_10425 [Chryseobacterium sp. KBW03]